MAASKWHSLPFFALLIIFSFASTNCVARQVGADDSDKHVYKPPSPKPSAGLSARLDGSYSWQYWQWSWGTPSPTWFPWGSSSLYCTPLTCYGNNCNSFYLEFDYDHIGFSYNYNYRRNEASMNENDKMSPRDEDKMMAKKRPQEDNQRDDNNDNNVGKNVKKSDSVYVSAPRSN